MYEEGDSRAISARWRPPFSAAPASVTSISSSRLYQDGATLEWHERPEYVPRPHAQRGLKPGNYIVPIRDDNGNLAYGANGLPSTRQMTDPSCGRDVSADQNAFGNSAWGNPLGNRCFLILVTPVTSWRHWIPPTLSILTGKSVKICHSMRNLCTTADCPRTPESSNRLSGRRSAHCPRELPGNLFRATSSTGAPLFADPCGMPAATSSLMATVSLCPFRDGNGIVALAQNQLPIDADPLGGVPFNEDVRITMASFGKNGIPNTLPLKMQQDGLNMELDDKRTYRIAFGADFTVPYLEGWEGTAFYTGQTKQNDIANQDFSFSAVEQGLNCDVITDVESCFNPFGAIDRFRNSQRVADSVFTQ